MTALAPARFVGSIETGKVYEQQVEVLMAPRPGEDADDVRIYRLVRVELTRATRGGDKTLLLLTDLSKSAATGKQVAELYRRRWTIETMFQQLEAHLHSEVNTLGYPAAALFAFCVALVAYNVLAVVKGALRGLHGEQTIHDTVSGYYIAGEIGRTYEALLGFVPADQWTQVQALSHEAFLTLLMGLARAGGSGEVPQASPRAQEAEAQAHHACRPAPRFHRQALGEETMTLPRDSEGPRSYRHVSSSTVAAITYERSTRTLGIRFQRGAEYRYFSVPETVYLELRSADSKGRYFNARIRDAGYTFQRVH